MRSCLSERLNLANAVNLSSQRAGEADYGLDEQMYLAELVGENLALSLPSTNEDVVLALTEWRRVREAKTAGDATWALRAKAVVDEVVDHVLRQLGAPRDERAAGGAADGGVGVLREGGGAADAAGAREALAAAGGVLGEDVGAPLRVNLCQAISSEYYECKESSARGAILGTSKRGTR